MLCAHSLATPEPLAIPHSCAHNLSFAYQFNTGKLVIEVKKTLSEGAFPPLSYTSGYYRHLRCYYRHLRCLRVAKLSRPHVIFSLAYLDPM